MKRAEKSKKITTTYSSKRDQISFSMIEQQGDYCYHCCFRNAIIQCYSTTSCPCCGGRYMCCLKSQSSAWIVGEGGRAPRWNPISGAPWRNYPCQLSTCPVYLISTIMCAVLGNINPGIGKFASPAPRHPHILARLSLQLRPISPDAANHLEQSHPSHISHVLRFYLCICSEICSRGYHHLNWLPLAGFLLVWCVPLTVRCCLYLHSFWCPAELDTHIWAEVSFRKHLLL